MFFSRVKMNKPNARPNTQIPIPYSNNWCPFTPRNDTCDKSGSFRFASPPTSCAGSKPPPSSSNATAAANFLTIPKPVDLATSNETLMNFPPNLPFSRGASPLPLPACAFVTAKLRTPVQSNQERAAPYPRSEPASARVISFDLKEIPRFKQDGNSSTPAQLPLRPWAGQDHPWHYPLCRATREDGNDVL